LHGKQYGWDLIKDEILMLRQYRFLRRESHLEDRKYYPINVDLLQVELPVPFGYNSI